MERKKMKREFLRLNQLHIRNQYYEKLDDLHAIFGEGESCVLYGRDHTGGVLTQFFGGDGEILSGNLFIAGKRVENFSKDTFYNAGIAYIDYRTECMDALDLGENLFLLKRNSLKKIMVDKKAIHIRAAEILQQYGLEADVWEKTQNISSVDKVLLNIVRAADRGAKMLVLNNISAICKAEDIGRLRGILSVAKRNKIALLIYDSHPQYFMDIADSMFFMNKGMIQKKIYDRQEFWLCEKLFPADREEPNKQAVQQNRTLHEEDEYRFSNLIVDEKEYIISLKPGEIIYLAVKTGEMQKQLCNALIGEGRHPVLFYDNQKECFYHGKQQLAARKIGFMGEELLESELFHHLSVKENIVMPSLKRISNYGFYGKSVDFLFKDKEFFQELAQIEESPYTENNIFKIIAYRHKLFHPKVLIVNNILTRADVEMKEWIAAFLREMAKRNTAVILLETEEKDALLVATRIIKGTVSKGA